MEASARSLPRRLGRYDVVGRLAFGGMAEILLARLKGPSGFERPAVIKRILPHLAAEPAFVDMFLDEGRLAARIRHPNVVQVQELCREDGELFLVMEYLEGEAASGLQRRSRVRARQIDRSLVAHVVAQAAAGLHAAHELAGPDGEPLDIVHRDMSPENIFIGYDGSVKVLDFGIAKARDRVTKTDAGMLKGKFEYMSPEQAQGEPLDRRSDVFSLGVVLYELSTGRRLFKRATQVATLRAITDDEVVVPTAIDPTYPPALEAVCMRAIARQRSGRYATAQDMRRALLEAMRTLDAPAAPDEALAALMGELFADRVDDKREMLASMRDGVTPTRVPEAEVDLAIEIPTIEADVASQIRTKPWERADESEPAATLGTGSRPRALWLGAGALAAAALAALWLARAVGAGPEAPDPPADAVHAEVTVTIDSAPPGAAVSVAGARRGVTPLELRVARGAEPIVLRLEHDGFVPLEERVVPEVDQRLRLTLAAVRPERRAGEGTIEAITPNETRLRGDAVSRARRRGGMQRAPTIAPTTTPATAPDAPVPETATDDGARDREFRRFN